MLKVHIYLLTLREFYLRSWDLLMAEEAHIDGPLAQFRLQKGILRALATSLLNSGALIISALLTYLQLTFIALMIIFVILSWIGAAVTAPVWIVYPLWKLRSQEQKFSRAVDDALAASEAKL